MSRLFDGSRFSIVLLGGALSVVILMILGSLVLSVLLPPRPVGFVTGDVRAGMGGLSREEQVIFERIDGPDPVSPDVVTVRTDESGHFSASLPPGPYYVDMTITACPRIGPCERRRQFFPIGTRAFAIAAGQHIEFHLGTCGDVWQCPH
jgi:hypothetical protein